MLCSGVRHQEPRDCREDKLSKKFLLNAEHSLGMHLAKGESVTLEQLVELFDLPSQVIEALHLRYRGLSSSQRREQEPWVIFANVDPNAPEVNRGGASASGVSRRGNDQAVVVSWTLLKSLDCLERMRLWHSNHEVNSGLAQSVQHLERRISSVKHDHVSTSQVWDQAKQLLPLTGRARRDRGSNWESADDIVERRNQHLRTVSAVRDSEMLSKLFAPLQVMAHAVHREEPAPTPEEFVRVLLAKDSADHGQERSQKLGLQLAPRFAERRRAHRCILRELDARSPRFLPKRIEHQGVAAATGIGGHEQQQCHQQLGGQLAVASEVSRPAPVVALPRSLKQLPDKDHERFVELRKYGGAVFGQPLACQIADCSFDSRENVIRRLSSAHSTTFIKRMHSQLVPVARGGSHAAWLPDRFVKVNGIAPDPAIQNLIR